MLASFGEPTSGRPLAMSAEAPATGDQEHGTNIIGMGHMPTST